MESFRNFVKIESLKKLETNFEGLQTEPLKMSLLGSEIKINGTNFCKKNKIIIQLTRKIGICL